MIGAVRGASHAARPPYLTYFALREPPFSPAADPRFFYADPARQQCLDLLLHLAEYSEQWLLVAGETGVGKSILLSEFLARADQHVRPCRIDGHPSTEGGQLFLRIAQCFGLDPARMDADPLETLRQHLNARHPEQVPMVIVDDADRLSDDALEIILRLAELEGDHGKLVRVVLFGTSTLLPRLGRERFVGLSQPHLMELRAFDEGNVGLYLAHRLSMAGYEGANPFDGKSVRRVYKETGGVPSRINTTADQVLREKMAAERSNGTGARVRRALIPVAALAGVGFVVLLVQGQWMGLFGSPLSADEALIATVPSAEPTVTRPTTVTPLPPLVEPAPLVTRPLVLREGEAVQVACSPLGETDSHAAVPAAPALTSSATSPQTVDAEAKEDAVMPDPAPVRAVAQTEPVGSKAKEEVPPPASAPISARTLAVSAAPEMQKGLAETLPRANTSPRAAAEPAATLSPQTFATGSAAEPKTHPATPAVSGAEWLRAQDPRHFTLQLLAASNDRTVRDFIGRHHLRAPHAVVKTMRNGSPLHLLAYESYATRQAATAAAKKLPTGLRAWPRPFGELQGVPKAATPFTAAPSELKDGAWLWSRDPRRITVQLVGAESEQALLGYVGKEPLAGPLAIFTTDRGGKPWFVLVYGDFADRDAALKARAALPARLRQGGPWLREFAAIHAILGPRSPSQP